MYLPAFLDGFDRLVAFDAFAQLFPGASKPLTSMCDRLVLDSSERDDRHGALLDAHMTADALGPVDIR
jgi:hypothetical protein